MLLNFLTTSPYNIATEPTHYDDHIDDHIDDPLPVKPPTETVKHPQTYEEDPDPSKTTYCTTPHSSTDRLVQYALMIDAGSTGSRIHIYKFNNCGPSAAYEY